MALLLAIEGFHGFHMARQAPSSAAGTTSGILNGFGWLIARLIPPDDDTAWSFEWELFRSRLRKRMPHLPWTTRAYGAVGPHPRLPRQEEYVRSVVECVWAADRILPVAELHKGAEPLSMPQSSDHARVSHVVPEPRRLHAYSWLSCGAGTLQVWTSEWFLPKAICFTAGPTAASVIHDSFQASTSNVASNP